MLKSKNQRKVLFEKPM